MSYTEGRRRTRKRVGGGGVISLDRQRYTERDIRGIRRRLNKIVADDGPHLSPSMFEQVGDARERTVNEIARGDEYVV